MGGEGMPHVERKVLKGNLLAQQINLLAREQ
jgi:hypothetical protein